jgi:hypothetical protein
MEKMALMVFLEKQEHQELMEMMELPHNLKSRKDTGMYRTIMDQTGLNLVRLPIMVSCIFKL